jgi:hypothetical protein
MGAGWLRDTRGISSVEFAMVAALFFLVVLGIVDFARALWNWNAAVKATQAGARFAAVGPVIALDLREFRGLSLGLRAGAAIPVGTPGTAPVICDSAGCGGDPARLDAAAFAALVRRMQRVDGRIAAANVVIAYRHIGQGFVGNPLGPDVAPAITVSLRAMTFELVTPGLSGLVSIPMPGFPATLTGEANAAT